MSPITEGEHHSITHVGSGSGITASDVDPMAQLQETIQGARKEAQQRQQLARQQQQAQEALLLMQQQQQAYQQW